MDEFKQQQQSANAAAYHHAEIIGNCSDSFA
jgi:hypothetical protein